jgi:heme exporter protein B
MSAPATLAAIAAFNYAFSREIKLTFRARAELGLVIVFFILTVGLFPIAFGADVELLKRVAPGVFWVASLFATVLALPRLFASDVADGSIEVWLTSAAPLPALFLGKIVALWCTTGLAVALLSVPLSLQFSMQGDAVLTLLASLLIGTPTLMFIGGLCQAIALASRGGSALLALLALPLMVPSLIFGVEAVQSTIGGQSAQANLLLLGAASLVALVLYVAGVAFAVKAALE